MKLKAGTLDLFISGILNFLFVHHNLPLQVLLYAGILKKLPMKNLVIQLRIMNKLCNPFTLNYRWSLCSSLPKHIGSVAFGALILALVDVLRFLFDYLYVRTKIKLDENFYK